MKTFTLKVLSVLFFFASTLAVAQNTTTISGTVKDGGTGETLAGVNIIVKGTVLGTITDFDGKFTLKVNSAPPLTIQASFIGFNTQELEVLESNVTDLDFSLEEAAMLGQEVVVSASRVEESILESPVSIEKLDILAVQNTASDDYYKSIGNLKGVDVTTSSINFQIINARGFNSTGNTRFVQLNDGMDTQAPALNFPIGNLNGPSVLDIESLELIPGASSALYGPNAFNGIILIQSKNAFDYQGLSAYAKVGVNHVGAEADDDISPLYDFSIRYAKAFKNKFAIKLNASYMRANDWQGTISYDRVPTPEGFTHNPAADYIHSMGDEASTNLGFLGVAAGSAYNWDIGGRPSLGDPGLENTFRSLLALFGSTTGTAIPSNYEVTDYLRFVPSQTVARTGYQEQDLIDYGAENLKLAGGLYYRPTDKLELSYLGNYGGGTSIYTGAQRYSLSNFSIMQHRLQLRGDNFFLRGYTTIENSGDSYITEFLGNVVNESWSSNNTWFATYAANYLAYVGGTNGLGLTPEEIDAQGGLTAQQQDEAHLYARERADILRYDPNSQDFADAKANGLNSGVVPDGPKFADKSKMYQFEGQYDFKNEIDFMSLQVGASYRIFDLRSNGTIFPDADGGIQINEYGAYVQGSKKVANDKIKFLGSVRFDKNENFNGQVNPRLSVVYSVVDNHNIRASYQTGFRNPTTQGQFIDLDIISRRLLGGLPASYEKYDIKTNSYTQQSVDAYTSAVYSGNAEAIATAYANLEPVEFEDVKPEQVQSVEVGYKGLFNNTFLVDAVYYYNIYNDFITQIQMTQASDDVFANPAAASSLIGASSANAFQVYTNIDREVTSQGAAIGLTYNLPSNFVLMGNYNWNVLNEDLAAEGFLAEFNTPEHKYNISFSNRKVVKNIGFNIAYRWQDAFEWQSSFGIGEVAAYSTLDAQVSYKLSKLKSILKVGGSNILNKQYNMSLGGPNIGAIYYVSVTFDQFMN